ncbi:hypothetical protein ACLB2K_022497 [Fragaria x ananassa]
MTCVTQYNAARLACTHKATPGTCDQRLSHTDAEIAKSVELRQTGLGQRQTTFESLENLKKEKKRLEKKITSLDASLLLYAKKLADLVKEKVQIKEIPELSAEELEEAKRLRDDFEKQRNNFKGLTWM